MNKSSIEKLLWSLALPGFGQLLNQRYVKGITLIFLELLINVQSNLNTVILLSFQGDIPSAINEANYQWLMFYPCLYFFSMWDAFKDAGGGKDPFSFLPFVFSAYLVTIGTIYSAKMTIFGVLFGPVFLPLTFVLPGVFIGLVVKRCVISIIK
ncbi:hypothetical protein [Ureibacillus sinduriensis]|uniref:Membrane protein n=1 Tax=Ureibacillus sinduriensis BLB-1 = JCM 15800 TaxID=1384057 RepID=A0A0A3IVG0_9BACL|nr:hypothetical protein [Ureibacillus sinduriensis]KGR78782.1 membrane protein [Ureibacillus sinduriensis BLB-1 = JCM 15800]